MASKKELERTITQEQRRADYYQNKADACEKLAVYYHEEAARHRKAGEAAQSQLDGAGQTDPDRKEGG